MRLAHHLRASKAAITERYVRDARQIDGLVELARPALIDHLPEFLDALASWLEGDDAAADAAFRAQIDGHALQRLGHGVRLDILDREYALLRRLLLEHLAAEAPQALLAELVPLNDALDRAIGEAIARYTRHTDEIRHRFIGILGHDLSNPLHAMQMSLSLLLADASLTARQRGNVERVQRSADRMRRMVRDVLDFTHSQLGGGIPSVPVRCDLGDLARAAVDEVSASHADLAFELETTGELAGYMDPDRISQALVNLLVNAAVHGAPPIRLRVYEEPDRAHVVTAVHDQGGSIPPELARAMFDPFRRGEVGKKRGLGLGLYIVEQIARAHGATVSTTSSAEAGTTIAVRWPRVPVDDVPDRG